MDKPVEVIFSDQAKEMYDYLLKKSAVSKEEMSILKAINRKIELIKEDFLYGEPIAKRIIPGVYKDKYNINNLYRVVLPNYWRMLYSLVDEDIKIIALIVDVVDHKDYSQKFGYRK